MKKLKHEKPTKEDLIKTTKRNFNNNEAEIILLQIEEFCQLIVNQYGKL